MYIYVRIHASVVDVCFICEFESNRSAFVVLCYNTAHGVICDAVPKSYSLRKRHTASQEEHKCNFFTPIRKVRP
jgi:hypothetical protein